jgi:threonine dehydratase
LIFGSLFSFGGLPEASAAVVFGLLERGSRVDTLVIALGGGALASGGGHVMKSLAPHVEVVAVQPAGRARYGAVVAPRLGRADRHHRHHR